MDPSASKQPTRTLPTSSILPQGDFTNLHTINMDNDFQPHNPLDHNAALWLKNVPPGCTIRDLIRAITSVGPTGRILYTKIMPPERLNQTWAAKVVYATREEARRLRALAQRNLFIMEGRRIWADWNRQLSTSFRAIEPLSRVVIIEGPSHIINTRSLERLFNRRLRKFDTEEVLVEENLVRNGYSKRATVVWRFGSWYYQAETAVEVLQEQYPATVDVRYGLDPCAYPAPDGFIP